MSDESYLLADKATIHSLSLIFANEKKRKELKRGKKKNILII